MRSKKWALVVLLLVSIGCAGVRKKPPISEPNRESESSFLCADTVQLGELQAFHYCPPPVAELICQDPEDARDLLLAITEIEADLDICGVELEGCRMEVEIRKGGKMRKLGWLLAAFAGGYIVADQAD